MEPKAPPAPAPLAPILRLLAAVLAAVALLQPFWFYSATAGAPGGPWVRSDVSYYGDRAVQETTTSTGTVREPRVFYYADSFDEPQVAAVLVNEFRLGIALAALGAVGLLLALPPLRRSRLRPLALLVDALLGLVAVGAPLYLAAAIGPAANADISRSIGGFQGSATGAFGLLSESWGPAIGWFLLLAGSAAALLGLLLGLRVSRAPAPRPEAPGR